MGLLHYGGETFRFDDRTLIHVQIALHEARRRDKEFFLTWSVPRMDGSGRMSAWITAGVPILFEYEGSRPPRINRDWVEQLITGAMHGSGLVVTKEQPAGTGA